MTCRTILFLAFTALHVIAVSQDFETESRTLIESKEWGPAAVLLKQWEKKEPASAEMRIAWFNFYLEQSRDREFQQEEKPADAPAGDLVYNDSLFNEALEQLRKGIRKNPARLDMYLGIAYALREKGEIEAHVQEMIKLIEQNKKLQSRWLWTKNAPLEDPGTFFKGTIQSYNYALFSMKEPQVDAIEAISRKMMQYYPEDIENYSNIGACYMLRGKTADALQYFEQAMEKKPGDMLVVSNIARAYEELGQKDKAIEYYRIMEQQGNYREIDFAKNQITKLQKAE